MKSVLLGSVALFGLSSVALAQDTTGAGVKAQTGQPAAASKAVSPAAASPTTSPEAAAEQNDANTIIVTATKRRQALADVPIAVTAISAQQLQNSGATDIRLLTQVAPSLLVTSDSSEAAGTGARIRGIGTVGDNPGLESSVATFIDGVYRSRTGVGLTELGEIERIEVLRGPQGTLFGRNASAGLINVVTKQPEFESSGGAEITYGNYNYLRLGGGITGALIEDKVALRIDGIFVKRDGFIRDETSGRDINNRNRFLVRPQLLIKPSPDLSIRLIGDYSKRNEECCAAVFLPAHDATIQNGQTVLAPSSVAALERALGATIIDNDPYNRKTAITAGRNYRSDVEDWGLSGEVNYDLGFANLTSITAYRHFTYLRGQDADYNTLDLLYRDRAPEKFLTFSQELRLQGRLFGNKLDYLVGGYFANEALDLTDNLKYGADYTRYSNCLVGANIAGAVGVPSLLSPANASTNGCLNPQVAGALAANPALPAATRGLIATFAGLNPALGGLSGYDAIAAAAGAPGATLNGTGETADRYHQNSRNVAIFTHNVFAITDRLSVTLGARYTNERKDLSVNLNDNNTVCAAIRNVPALVAAGLATLPCVIQSFPGGNYTGSSSKMESQVTGTAVLSYKPVDRVLVYASYAKGYKAGGFNLDRSAIQNANAVNLNDLKFQPEKVDSVELGGKLDLRALKLNVALFHEVFDNFQLNTFNGVNFIVANLESCGSAVATPTATVPGGTCPGSTGGGVRAQGVEAEASLFVVKDLALTLGYTYADTKYRTNLTGLNGSGLAPTLALLPGQQISSAPKNVVTASAGWNPEITKSGYRALVYADLRYQSAFNTGSDLAPEKIQAGIATVNARLALQAPNRLFSVELWAQNLFNQNNEQVAFDAPLQGSNNQGLLTRGLVSSSTALFGSFLAEPRTFGLTLRTSF